LTNIEYKFERRYLFFFAAWHLWDLWVLFGMLQALGMNIGFSGCYKLLAWTDPMYGLLVWCFDIKNAFSTIAYNSASTVEKYVIPHRWCCNNLVGTYYGNLFWRYNIECFLLDVLALGWTPHPFQSGTTRKVESHGAQEALTTENIDEEK